MLVYGNEGPTMKDPTYMQYYCNAYAEIWNGRPYNERTTTTTTNTNHSVYTDYTQTQNWITTEKSSISQFVTIWQGIKRINSTGMGCVCVCVCVCVCACVCECITMALISCSAACSCYANELCQAHGDVRLCHRLAGIAVLEPRKQETDRGGGKKRETHTQCVSVQ